MFREIDAKPHDGFAKNLARTQLRCARPRFYSLKRRVFFRSTLGIEQHLRRLGLLRDCVLTFNPRFAEPLSGKCVLGLCVEVSRRCSLDDCLDAIDIRTPRGSSRELKVLKATSWPAARDGRNRHFGVFDG